MKLPSWTRSPWVRENLPTLMRVLSAILDRRTPRGPMTKVGLLLAALVLMVASGCGTLDCLRNPLSCGIGGGFPETPSSPSPSPTVEPSLPPSPAPCGPPECEPAPPPCTPPACDPAPVPSTDPAPSPSPSASPTAPPTDPAPCVPTCPTPPAGWRAATGAGKHGPKPGVCYAAVQVNIWTNPENPAEKIDDTISWDTCDPCSEWRSSNVAAGHWIDEGRRDGLLRANARGSADGDKYVTRECVLVWADTLGHFAEPETGRIGKVCPRKLDPQPTCTPPPAPPSPSPSAPPSTPPGAPAIDPATGNYPMPPAETCPAHFADSLSRYGISELSRRACSGNCQRDGYLGIIVTVSATPKSRKPYCPHAADRQECEQWRPCQDGFTDWQNPTLGPDLLMTLPGHWTDARVDKRSDNNHLGHHKPKANETGIMTFKACPRGAPPSDPRCGVSPPVRVP